jgi:hypothetical protein
VRRTVKDTPRSQIVVGRTANIMDGWLVQVDEAWVDERGQLRCRGPVISRPLCADTLVRGEQHNRFFWVAR